MCFVRAVPQTQDGRDELLPDYYLTPNRAVARLLLDYYPTESGYVRLSPDC